MSSWLRISRKGVNVAELRADAHCVAVRVQVEPERAFRFLADGMNQGYWALGSWDRREVEDGVFVGTSLFDGRELYVRPVPRPETVSVDFETGRSAGELRHHAEARVVPSEILGGERGSCVVSLTVWRSADVDDDTWELLGHTFATEIHMIKGRLELEVPSRQ